MLSILQRQAVSLEKDLKDSRQQVLTHKVEIEGQKESLKERDSRIETLEIELEALRNQQSELLLSEPEAALDDDGDDAEGAADGASSLSDEELARLRALVEALGKTLEQKGRKLTLTELRAQTSEIQFLTAHSNHLKQVASYRERLHLMSLELRRLRDLLKAQQKGGQAAADDNSTTTTGSSSHSSSGANAANAAASDDGARDKERNARLAELELELKRARLELSEQRAATARRDEQITFLMQVHDASAQCDWVTAGAQDTTIPDEALRWAQADWASGPPASGPPAGGGGGGGGGAPPYGAPRGSGGAGAGGVNLQSKRGDATS